MSIPKTSYPTVGYVYSAFLGREVPILDIPMMSDERWSELAAASAKNRKVVSV